MLLSGTQFVSNVFNYGLLVLANSSSYTSWFSALEALATIPARDRSQFILGLEYALGLSPGAAKEFALITLLWLYGLYPAGDSTATAQAQVRQIVSECDKRRGGCVILSGDVHNGYVSQLGTSTRELTSPSVSAPGVAQSLVVSLDQSPSGVATAVAEATDIALQNMLQTRNVSDTSRVLADTLAFIASPSRSTYNSIVQANSPPKVPFADIGHHGFGITRCTRGSGCSLQLRGLPLGCINVPYLRFGCDFRSLYTSANASAHAE